MRTFRVNAPIIMGAGCLTFCVLAPAPAFAQTAPMPVLRGSEAPVQAAAAPGADRHGTSFAALRAELDADDRRAALTTLLLALQELGDGQTMVWKRPAHHLSGAIKAISAFRDEKGRVCRHISYTLTLGSYSRQVTGNACREDNGSWSLSG